jgi:serine/threonine protein phosphatase PrpC
MNIHAAHLSDVGRVRTGNEDCALCKADPTGTRGYLLVVADGMGGAAAGEVASRMAVDTVGEVYFASRGSVAEALTQAVTEANARIHRAAQVREDAEGMGTTCTALAVVDEKIYMAYVGDSRAYRIRGKRITRLTRDESVWAEKVREGETPASEYGRNQLTRAVGLDPELHAEPVRESEVCDGDRFVLCSDGLWGLVTDPEILLLAQSGDLAAACRRLVALANNRGGHDNVTVIVAEATR